MPNRIPTYEEFIIEFPVMIPPAVSESDAQYQLDFAARLLCKSAWGDWYSDAIVLIAAHNLSLWLATQSDVKGGIQSAVGNVVSTSGAGLSISFESSDSVQGSKSDAWYNKTLYGQKYLHLKSLVIPSACLSF